MDPQCNRTALTLAVGIIPRTAGREKYGVNRSHIIIKTVVLLDIDVAPTSSRPGLIERPPRGGADPSVTSESKRLAGGIVAS